MSPYIGYAATAEIAKEAVRTGRTIHDLVLERGLLDDARLNHQVEVVTGVRSAECGALLSEFFQRKRS